MDMLKSEKLTWILYNANLIQRKFLGKTIFTNERQIRLFTVYI